MKNINVNLQAARKERKLSQEQIAFKLNMVRSAYSKLEAGITQLTLQKAYEIAQVLNMDLVDLLNKYGNNVIQKQSAAEKERRLELYKNTVLSLILTKLMIAQQEFQEPVTFEELDESGLLYLRICDIKTKEEYEQAGLLIARTPEGKEQQVFETMINDIDVYSFFEFGLVDYPHLIYYWDVFKAKNKPIFKYENGMATRIERPEFDTAPF